MEIGDAEPGVSAVGRALDAWAVALDQLVAVVEDGGLDGLDDAGLLDVARGVERVRNRSVLVDHRLVRDLEGRRVAESVGQPSTAALLAWLLRISRGEASRRVRAAEAVGVWVAMTGEVLDPVRPALAAVQRAGDVSPDQLDLCLRALATVDRRGFDPAHLEAADGLLAEFACVFPPAELRELAVGIVERIDPDGTLPAEQVNADRRHLAFRKARDGMWLVEGRLTGEVGAKLTAVLSPLAAPRVEPVELDDGRIANTEDPRHHGQRTHDALGEVCDRLLRAGTLPDAGGVPTTLVVTVAEDDLRAGRGHGTTSDGTLLPISSVLRIADQADVIGVRISTTGAVLDLGRTRRCASPSQTMALVARDGGCSFPGCTRPPGWCERHHVRAWTDGGPTDLDNLTLLCSYHHHQFAGRGWTCQLLDGLPAWTPPAWIDPHQRPLTNTRITARTTTRKTGRERLRC